jgi:hypothetical protein
MPSELRVDPKHPAGPPASQVMNDLLVRHGGQIEEKASLEAIEKFVRHHLGAVRTADGNGYKHDATGNLATNDYVKNKQDGYAEYAKPANYTASVKHLKEAHYI